MFWGTTIGKEYKAALIYRWHDCLPTKYTRINWEAIRPKKKDFNNDDQNKGKIQISNDFSMWQRQIKNVMEKISFMERIKTIHYQRINLTKNAQDLYE